MEFCRRKDADDVAQYNAFLTNTAMGQIIAAFRIYFSNLLFPHLLAGHFEARFATAQFGSLFLRAE
jgi:hypothetical protein